MRRLLLVLLVLLATGCSASSDPRVDGPPEQESAAAMHAVLDELRRDEQVVEATGEHSTSLTTYGQVGIVLTVADGTPEQAQEALLDRAEQLVWRSPVEPLLSLGLVVLEPGTPADAPGRQRHYRGEGEVAQLADRYGPR